MEIQALRRCLHVAMTDNKIAKPLILLPIFSILVKNGLQSSDNFGFVEHFFVQFIQTFAAMRCAKIQIVFANCPTNQANFEIGRAHV